MYDIYILCYQLYTIQNFLNIRNQWLLPTTYFFKTKCFTINIKCYYEASPFVQQLNSSSQRVANGLRRHRLNLHLYLTCI